MIRRLVVGLLLLALFVVVAPAVARQDKNKDKKKPEEKPGEAVALKWDFAKNKLFYQTLETVTKQDMVIMTNPVNQTQKQIFYFSWKVTTPENNNKVTLEQEIIGVKMDIQIGGSNISYDSTKDAVANNPLGDFFKALVGSKFTVTLNTKDLKVEDVGGRDDFIKKLVAANPQMRQLLDTILSKEALREMSEPTFAVIMTSPKKKGEKWERSTKLDMGPIGTYNNKYEFTYEGATGDEHTIKCTTTLEYKQPNDASGGGLPFKIKSASLPGANPVGLIKFNNKTGRLTESKTQLVISKGKLVIEIGGQTTDVELNQDQTSTITISDTPPITLKK